MQATWTHWRPHSSWLMRRCGPSARTTPITYPISSRLSSATPSNSPFQRSTTNCRILAKCKAAFEALGCRIAISSASFVDLTLDKYQTGIVFGGAGIHVPWSWLPPLERSVDLPSRVFVKPRRGSASQDLFNVARGDLSGVLPLVSDPIVQEILVGPEVTIDALFDFDGRPIHYVPRLRLRTLGGESVQGVTMDHDEAMEIWIERLLRLCSRLGAAGPLTIQAFQTDDGFVLSEINPEIRRRLSVGARRRGQLRRVAAGHGRGT